MEAFDLGCLVAQDATRVKVVVRLTFAAACIEVLAIEDGNRVGSATLARPIKGPVLITAPRGVQVVSVEADVDLSLPPAGRTAACRE